MSSIDGDSTTPGGNGHPRCPVLACAPYAWARISIEPRRLRLVPDQGLFEAAPAAGAAVVVPSAEAVAVAVDIGSAVSEDVGMGVGASEGSAEELPDGVSAGWPGSIGVGVGELVGASEVVALASARGEALASVPVFWSSSTMASSWLS